MVPFYQSECFSLKGRKDQMMAPGIRAMSRHQRKEKRGNRDIERVTEEVGKEMLVENITIRQFP